MRTVLKRVGYWLAYALFLLAFAGIVDYFFFYRPYIEKIREHKVGPLAQAKDTHLVELASERHISPEQMQLLGKAKNDKVSVFTKFEQRKEPGVLRICALGDSFTAGDEVNQSRDYPTRLAKIFEEAGARNVEVINFGIGGYGFHQTYMMWDLVARKFDCDFHLLGPRGFQPLRDTTFGYIYHWSPYYLHARYVLEDGDARLVEVLGGDSYGDRFDAHFRFIQPWRYLRYSRSTPIFLKAMLPPERDLPNPFYYDRRPMEEEAADLQRILLTRMAQSGSLFFVGHHRPSVIETAALADTKSAESSTLGAAVFHEPISFPYVAPQTHSSSPGYDYLARQFFAHLTGRAAEPIVITETEDLEWTNRSDAPRRERRALSSYEKIEFAQGEIKLGQFTGGDLAKVDALMSIDRPGQSVLDSCYFPVEFELQPGMDLVLRVASAGGNQDHVLGRLSVLDQLNIGAAKIEGFEFWQYKRFEQLRERGEPSPLTDGKKRSGGLFFSGNAALSLDQVGKGKISILVDGKPALQGERGELGLRQGIWFSPFEGPFRFVRANTFGLVDVPALAEDSGTTDILLEHWEDGTVRVPMAGWKKKSILPTPARRSPAKVISIEPDGRAVLKDRSSP